MGQPRDMIFPTMTLDSPAGFVSLAFSEGWAILDVAALCPLPMQLLGSLGVYPIS